MRTIIVSIPDEAIERFWSRVNGPTPDLGCWLWTGATDKHGYGVLTVNGLFIGAHRFAYWYTHGYYGSDHIHHKCFNRLCANPFHLERKTPSEHRQTMREKKHCQRGHRFSKKNTLIRKNNTRMCRRCDAENKARRYYLGRPVALARALERIEVRYGN